MSRILLIPLLTATIALSTPKTNGQHVSEIQGTATNNLRPEFTVELEYGTNGPDWRIGIDLVAQTDFPTHSWLKILHPTGAKLRVWMTNGVEVSAATTNAPAGTLPPKTAVSNILNSVYRRYRGAQWWPGGNFKASTGESFLLSGFKLGSVFDYPFTNDVVLQ